MPIRSTANEAFHEVPFKLDSICAVPAPEGSQGPWHSYVISQGANTITGMRQGTEAEVTLLVQEMITRLNERRAGKKRTG